jgi:hypothetical protein
LRLNFSDHAIHNPEELVLIDAVPVKDLGEGGINATDG